MNIKIFLILNILKIFIQFQKQNKSKQKIYCFKNKYIFRKLEKSQDILKLNNITNIYSPFNIVSYISSVTSKSDDLFIALNTELKDEKRLIYAIKSDGSNFFEDINSPYKILIHNNNQDSNIYPLLALLKKNNKQYLVEITFDSRFELYDYYNNVVYALGLFQVMRYNSRIYKNTFISLDYYDNNDYILNAFVERAGDNNFVIQKLYYNQIDISKKSINYEKDHNIPDASKYSQVSCFEILNLIECLYVDEFSSYNIGIFNIIDLDLIFNVDLNNNIRAHELFSKCIHYKGNISAIIYFLNDNSKPILSFKNLYIEEKKLDDYREKININKDDDYEINNYYIYNDFIKINENNLYYISTKEESDIIMIIMIKSFDNSTNILINYYEIKLNEYKIKIYKDITVFKYNELLGIGITHYNYSLTKDNTTYGSYFMIGYSYANDIIMSRNDYIFNKENNFTLKIADYINIDNNIFGYTIKEIKILSDLNQNNLGFHLFSNELNKTIEVNEILSSSDAISFILISEKGIKLDKYIIEYSCLITESNYEDFISFPNSYEYYSNNEISLESLYQPQKFDNKKASIIININYCYKTCGTCSYLGDEINHHCDTCSDKYPFSFIKYNSLINQEINCVESCPENYTATIFNICSDSLEENNDKCGVSNLTDIDELIGCEFYNNIKSIIKFISDNKIIIDNITSFKIYAYEIGEDRKEFCLENNLIYIDFKDSQKNLLNIFNLENDTNIYLLLVEFPSNYRNPATDDFDFTLVFENGTELNLSYLKKIFYCKYYCPNDKFRFCTL